MGATPVKTASVTTIDEVGRGRVVVEDIIEKPAQVDSEHTTAIVDKVEPGRDLFAEGGQYKHAESKEVTLPVEQEVEEQKQISSVFQTEIVDLGKKEDDTHILLPDENTATGSLPLHASIEVETPLKDPSVAGGHESDEKMAGPLDYVEAEEERARKNLYPNYND